jgi:hypothetical protein
MTRPIMLGLAILVVAALLTIAPAAHFISLYGPAAGLAWTAVWVACGAGLMWLAHHSSREP